MMSGPTDLWNDNNAIFDEEKGSLGLRLLASGRAKVRRQPPDFCLCFAHEDTVVEHEIVNGLASHYEQRGFIIGLAQHSTSRSISCPPRHVHVSRCDKGCCVSSLDTKVLKAKGGQHHEPSGEIMSDWERIFGAGVSGESVIDGINASWERQWTNEEEEKAKIIRDEQIANLSAYRGNASNKSDFVSSLSKQFLRVERPSNEGLLGLIRPEHKEYADLEVAYRFPLALSHIISEIFYGLHCATPSLTTDEALKIQAFEWLVQCFQAIPVGVDLRFVSPKLLASVARESLDFFETNSRYNRHGYSEEILRRVSSPAIGIIYARARGVLAQDDIVTAAASAAWDAVSSRWTEGFNTGEDYREDFGLAAITCAVNPSPEEGAKALQWACYGRWEDREYGDANLATYYYDYGTKLIDLLKSAPTVRTKIVNLNDLSNILCEFIGDNPVLTGD